MRRAAPRLTPSGPAHSRARGYRAGSLLSSLRPRVLPGPGHAVLYKGLRAYNKDLNASLPHRSPTAAPCALLLSSHLPPKSFQAMGTPLGSMFGFLFFYRSRSRQDLNSASVFSTLDNISICALMTKATSAFQHRAATEQVTIN